MRTVRRRWSVGMVALGAAGALALAACGSSGGGTSSKSTGGTTGAAFNAAVNSVVSPSAHKGGTIIFDNSSAPDSTDAGNTYYAFNLNFTRLYA